MGPFSPACTTVWCWEGRRSAGKQTHTGIRRDGYSHQYCFFWCLSLSCGANAEICTVNKVQMENHMVTVSPSFSRSTELSSMHRHCKKVCEQTYIPHGMSITILKLLPPQAGERQENRVPKRPTGRKTSPDSSPETTLRQRAACTAFSRALTGCVLWVLT